MSKVLRWVIGIFGVFAASAAFAQVVVAETTLLAEWLFNGASVNELTSISVTGGVMLEDTETIAGASAVLCTFTVDGSVGPNGEDEAVEILNANGAAVGGLVGLALLGTGAANGEGSECVTVKTCAAGTSASPVEVWPIGLPWHGLLSLLENGEFSNVKETGTKTVGYEILCLVLGLDTEDTCTVTHRRINVINDAETGDAAVPAGAEGTPRYLCTQSGKESGSTIADELTAILPLTGLLTASSE
jgi:hypothetical protein